MVAIPPRRSNRILRTLSRLMMVLPMVAAAIYGIAVFYMVRMENKLVFFPSKPDQEWEPKPDECIQDVTLHTVDGALHAWYCEPEKPDAVFLICHGNAGNVSLRGKSLLEYRDRFNGAVMIFDYPGYGLSDGEPSEHGCYAAADAAYDFLISKGFQPNQIVVNGESLGGGVAVDLASRRPCAGLVLINTFAQLPAVAQRLYRWLPVDLLMTNRFDSAAKIKSVRVPIFVTHGSNDDLIPFDHSRGLFECADCCAKEYLLREGKGHYDPLDLADLDTLHQFFTRHGVLPQRIATR